MDPDSMEFTKVLTLDDPSFVIEHVEVMVDADHVRPNDLQVTLTSPLGLTSTLLRARGDLSGGVDHAPLAEQVLTSVAFLGYAVAHGPGDWTLLIEDTGTTGGTLTNWSTRFFGYHALSPSP
jgi:subtilisin-like proprotein convertase family protein